MAAMVRASWGPVSQVEVEMEGEEWAGAMEVGVRVVAAAAVVSWVASPVRGIQRNPGTCSGSSLARGCLGTS